MNNDEIASYSTPNTLLVSPVSAEQIKENRANIDKLLINFNNEKERILAKLVNIIVKNIDKVDNDELVTVISSYLYKKGFSKFETSYIFEKSLKNEQNLSTTFDRVHNVFSKNKKDVSGLDGIRRVFSKDDADTIKIIIKELLDLRKKIYNANIDNKIIKKLKEDSQPNSKLIVESIEQYCDVFHNYDNLRYYVKVIIDNRKHIREIDSTSIMDYCNKAFGFNQVSKRRCREALQYITRPIKKDYRLLEFTNGSIKIFNDKITFSENKFYTDRIPKMILPFEWNPIFEPDEENKIEEIIENTFQCNEKGFENNLETFLLALGHAFMPSIEKHIIVILVGPPKTGKSTINTMLKRIFNYSEVPIPIIVRNERFGLHPTVDKDINIDDDLQNSAWKDIGKLNTFISGNGGSVEVKGQNDRILLNPWNTPKLFAGSNALPPVEGEGFNRRIILIKAENIIPDDKMDDLLQKNILDGFYDKGLAKLTYRAIKLYNDNREKPIISSNTRKSIQKEWKWKSNPLEIGIKSIFINRSHESFENKSIDDNYLTVNEVNYEIKKWCDFMFKRRKIYAEHKTPSTHEIKKAMEKAGYSQFTKNKQNWNDDTRTTFRCYSEIQINPKWNKIKKNI